MGDSFSSPSAVSLQGDHMAGVAVSVLRDALDLMETQGEAVVAMINSAPGAGDIVSGALDALSDPLIGHNVDLFV
jgi:hypothetical protein